MSELLAAVDRVLRSAVRPIVHTVVPRSLDVEGALRMVRALLAERARASWREMLAAGVEPWRALVAVTRAARDGATGRMSYPTGSAVCRRGDCGDRAARRDQSNRLARGRGAPPLAKLLEAALFASGAPVPLDELAALDPDATGEQLTAALTEIAEHYGDHGVELVEAGAGGRS